MWRRRASYDPMKAAMEGKKRQEEAKRQLLAQQSKLPERCAVFDLCSSANKNANRFASRGVGGGAGGGGDFIYGSSKLTRRQLV